MDRLATYVAAWKSCAADVEELLLALGEDDWSADTDCPGWTVRDVAAHLAALEAEIAGAPGPRLDQVSAATANVSGAYTQAGVEERRDRTPQELVDEFTDAVQRRAAELDADPPSDPSGRPARTPGDVSWDWETMLRNRVIDLWVHEQDIRRAVDRPGDLDTPAARVTAETFLAAMPYVIAKKAGAEPGTVVALTVDGVDRGFAVDDDGRCAPTEAPPAEPAVRLRMTTETLTILGAGRRDPLTVEVGIEGDDGLAERVLQGMAVTR